MAGSSRNPRIPEWSSGGRRDSNRRPATGRLPRRTTGVPTQSEQPAPSSFVPDEFRTENDLPLVPDSPQLQAAPAGGVETHLNLPLDQDPAAISEADAGPGQPTVFADKYELLLKVGEGGMGSVYKAHNRLLNVDVALKVLTPDKITSPDVRERFLREARATQMFRHRHAIAVQEVGELSDGTVYLTMDFSSGENLDARIRRLGRLSLDEAILITLQVLDALAEAHRTGIVHRDLKPGNIMVEIVGGRPSAMVVDFGIAKILQDTGIVTRNAPLTSPGLILGTVEYMSPEQAGGAIVDARSDIYSMGAVLYHMLTGQLPSPSETVQNMIINIMFQPPTPIREIVTDGTIPQEVEAVVMKALSKSTDERYQSAHEFGDALRMASADYLPDDTRTQSSSFRLPVAANAAAGPISNDAVSVPTVHMLPAYEEMAADGGEASGGFHLGTAQKLLAALAVVLLLAVAGLAVYKKMGVSAGEALAKQLAQFDQMLGEARQSGEWDKLYEAAHEAAAGGKNLPAQRYEWIAATERAIKQAHTLGPRYPENYMAGLESAEKTLAERQAGDPEYLALEKEYTPRLKQTRALLDGYLRLRDADKALAAMQYPRTLELLVETEGLFQAAGQGPPGHVQALRQLAGYKLCLQNAADARLAALEAEGIQPATAATAEKADRHWQKMFEELRAALRLEALQPDGTLAAVQQGIYRNLLTDYVHAVRNRGVRFLPVAAPGTLSDADLAQLPVQVDQFQEFLKRRQEPLAVPCAPDRPIPLNIFLADGAFTALRDEINLKFAERLVREADWQQKRYHLDLTLVLLRKALSIALQEAVPVLRLKIDEVGRLQEDMDSLLKSAQRAHLDGQELEAEALYSRFLQLYAAAPQATQAATELRGIRAIIEKAVGFKITSSTPGAEVFLNGQDRPVGRTPMIVTADHGLLEGKDNKIELRLEGFEAMVNTRRFAGNSLVPLDFTLKAKRGKLVVKVGEPNVAVIVMQLDANNRPIEASAERHRTNSQGETTWDEIAVGNYLVDIQPPLGLTPVKKNVVILETPATLVDVKLQAAPAELTLRTDPANLKVFINGVEQPDRTTLTLQLPAGPVHVVIVDDEGFQLPLDFDLKAGEPTRPPTIQFNFENERQKEAWNTLKAVVDNPQSTLADKVSAQLAFLREVGGHARANKVRADLDALVPAYLSSRQSAPANYLSFVADYLKVMPKGQYVQSFLNRVNTMIFFPYYFPAAKGYQNGLLRARAENRWDYLLRWGDSGLQVLTPRGETLTIYAGFAIDEVLALQGCDDILWMRERPGDVLGRTRVLSKMLEQRSAVGIESFQKNLNQSYYGDYGLISEAKDGDVWLAPVVGGKVSNEASFYLNWKDGCEAHILPNGNTLHLSHELLPDKRVATTLLLCDDKGEGKPTYAPRQLARTTLDPISSPYTVYRVSPEGSMVVLHGLNNGEHEYRVVRTRDLNFNDFYSHFGKVNNLVFGSRGTRLVVHVQQSVKVLEIGGMNALKREVSGVFESVTLSADDQYLILARINDFAVLEIAGNAPPQPVADQHLLAIDPVRERVLCGKDRDLNWLYWKTGELVKIAEIDGIWKSAQGANAEDPAPRLPQILRAVLLNGGHCALQLQDGGVLYFDVNAPQRLSETDLTLLKNLREDLKKMPPRAHE